jgi:hypothetical protein
MNKYPLFAGMIATPALAQILSVGVKAGVPLGDAFTGGRLRPFIDAGPVPRLRTTRNICDMRLSIPRGMVAGDRNSRGSENTLPLLRSRGSASGFRVHRG